MFRSAWCWPCLDLPCISFLCNIGNLHSLRRLLPNHQDTTNSTHHLPSLRGLHRLRCVESGVILHFRVIIMVLEESLKEEVHTHTHTRPPDSVDCRGLLMCGPNVKQPCLATVPRQLAFPPMPVLCSTWFAQDQDRGGDESASHLKWYVGRTESAEGHL